MRKIADGLEERLWLSRDLYNCMKGLLDVDVFDGGSLAHVQDLLFVALYPQCALDPRDAGMWWAWLTTWQLGLGYI